MQSLIYKIRLLFLEHKWMKQRIETYKKLNQFRENALKLEKQIHGFRKKRDEMELTKERDRDGFFEINGFVKGIEWALGQNWDDVRSDK